MESEIKYSGVKFPNHRKIQKQQIKALKKNYKTLRKVIKERLIYGAKTRALREVIDLSRWKVGAFNEIALKKELESLGYTVEAQGVHLIIYL